MKPSIVAVIILSGFGLGCSDSSVDGGAVSDGGAPTQTQGLNGSLSGKMVGTDGFDNSQPVSIDLSTGQRTELPLNAVQDLVSSTQPFDLSSNFSLLVPGGFTSAASYLQLFPACNDRSSAEVDDACWSFVNSQFVSEGAGVLPGIQTRFRPKLSPSGQRFAIVEYEPLDFDKSFMKIFSAIDGSLEQTLSLPIDKTFDASLSRLGAPSIEWGPNDELIYANPANNPPVVFITEPGTYEVAKRFTLPAQYSGVVASINISPDGKKLLLNYSRLGGQNGSFPFILDLETLALTQPAVTETDVGLVPQGDNQLNGSNIGIRGWSEDSQWIFLTYQNFNATPIIGQTIDGDNQSISFIVAGGWHISAVPANASSAVLSPDPSISTQGVISPIRYRDDNGDVKVLWGADLYSPIGVK